MQELKKVVFIGSGKVVFHLSQAIAEVGLQISCFYSRNIESAQALALKHQSEWHDLEHIELLDTDLVIVSVPDEALHEVMNKTPKSRALIVHTSGSMDMDILSPISPRLGVFYPLQTFSKEKAVDFQNVPFLIEAHDEKDLILLEQLAKKISTNVYQINSLQRKKIHIAAVFSCNFTNYLFHIAEDILEQADIPFEILKPLIAETADKIKELRPFHAQTGPAVRRDHSTIDAHLQALENEKKYQEIYQLLSESIMNSRKK